jgi:serine/threonine protein kinase
VRFESPIPYGAYLLTERIGVGGTAEIFRAVRRRSPGEAAVALKRLLPHIAEDPILVRLLQREVAALKRISHPNVVGLLDHGIERGLPFLVMDLVDGVSLARLLNRGDGQTRTMPVAVALSIVADVAYGLAEAWRQGIVHRDVSPTNIQVTAHGDVKILDFGLARVRGMAQTTPGQGLKGKWAYLSPEQLEGLPLDGRSDLFALGSVMYQLLVGQPPFRGSNREETLRKLRDHDFVALDQAETPEQLIAMPPADWMPTIGRADAVRLVHALLAKLPSERPEDGDAVALRTRDLLGETMADERYRHWLAEEVSHAAPVPEVWRGEAAELRGETVTDPVGENVTNVNIQRRTDRAVD